MTTAFAMKTKHKYITILVLVAILVIPTLVGVSSAKATESYEFHWCKVVGGGGESNDGTYTLKGTIPVASNTPEPAAAPSLEPLEVIFEVTFDGKECIVEGPTEVSMGKYNHIFHNLTDKKGLKFWVGQMLDGKTYQYLLDQ